MKTVETLALLVFAKESNQKQSLLWDANDTRVIQSEISDEVAWYLHGPHLGCTLKIQLILVVSCFFCHGSVGVESSKTSTSPANLLLSVLTFYF